jgi:hypothetical protein
MSVFFNGQLLISPTTASVVNDSAMRNQNLSVGNAVAILGTSSGGAPKTALNFGSPQEAIRTLVSGELLDAVLAAFDPSRETNGPSRVIVFRVNPALQASGVLKESGGTNVINLKSSGYGAGQNAIMTKIEAGSVKGLRPTVQLGRNYFSIDNLTRNAFTLRYSGAEATAVATITGESVVLQAPTGTPVATLDLNQYPTIQALVDRINLVAGFAAVVGDGNYSKPALNGLDFITAQDVKTATITVKADLQAVVDWINGAQEDFLTATRVSGAGKPPAVSAFAPLTGGSDGVTTITDWADTFTALQSTDAQWVTPVTPNSAIHAMADAHCVFMSNVGRKERRAICGMDVSTTDTAAIAAAKALNSDRTSLMHIGHYNYNADGVLTLYPAYISAALISGAFAGVNPGTPLTNKSIHVQGLERSLRNPIDTDVLINGGVLCVESTAQGYKVVKSISTWLVNSNYNRVEQSCGVALDFTTRNVREALDVLRGSKGNPLVLSRAASITQSALAELAREEPQGPGVLAGNKDSPAYRNIKATLEGDVLRVEFECSPVIPVNYVLATIYAVPFSGVSTSVLGS